MKKSNKSPECQRGGQINFELSEGDNGCQKSRATGSRWADRLGPPVHSPPCFFVQNQKPETGNQKQIIEE